MIQRTTNVASEIIFERLGGKTIKKMDIKDPTKPEMDGEYMSIGLLHLEDFTLKKLEDLYGIRDEDDEIF